MSAFNIMFFQFLTPLLWDINKKWSFLRVLWGIGGSCLHDHTVDVETSLPRFRDVGGSRDSWWGVVFGVKWGQKVPFKCL